MYEPSKNEADEAIADLLFAHKHASADAAIVTYEMTLGYLYDSIQEQVDAAKYWILAQLRSDEDQYVQLYFLEYLSESKGKLNRLLKEIDQLLERNEYKWKERFARFFLKSFIELLHSKQEYQKLVELAQQFSESSLRDAQILFEVAYAYEKVGDKSQSKQYYLYSLKQDQESHAVRFNLGLLYNEEGNLEQAEIHFQRALELSPSDGSAKRALENVQAALRKAQQQKRAGERAKDLFLLERKSTRRAISALYAGRTSDDLVLCDDENAATLLGTDSSDVHTKIDEFIEKKYFDLVTEHGLAFDGKVLRVNSILVPLLEAEVEKAKREQLIEDIATQLLPASLDQKYEYNPALVQQLSKLNSHELTLMLERDLREGVTALATQSYKSAIVLCGSIVEAVLLDRLQVRAASAIQSLQRLMQKENKKFTSNDAILDRWSLSTLLDVALEEKIITENLYYWGHGLRGFRNLVHPGLEQRRAVEVSPENAMIAWQVVKTLLRSIK